MKQYVNHELPDVQAGFRKGRGTRDQIASIRWIIEKAKEFQKSIYFCFVDYTKAFDCVYHDKLWKILEEMEIPDHLTCLLRKLNAGQKVTVRTLHGTTDWFQTGKGQFSFQHQRMLKLLHNCTHLIRLQSNAQNSPSQASTVREL